MSTITIDRAVVEQALEALEADCCGGCDAEYNPCRQRRLAESLRAALAQQAEPVEPVAWNWMLDGQPYGQAYYGRPPDADIVETSRLREDRTVRLLYTAPPQRKPLPKHDQHCVDVPGYGLMAVRLVRAVERAHGIKEN